jgi:chitin synthase
MDYQGQRPPRAHRPSYSQYPRQPPALNSPPSYIDQPASYTPHTAQSYESVRSANNVAFHSIERGDRRSPLDQPGRVRQHSAYQNVLSLPSPDPETGYAMADATLVGRKKSLVRPDREKIEPGHRQWHYRTHAARLEDTNANLVQPSSMFLYSSKFICFVNTFLLSHRQCPSPGSPSPWSVALGS